MNLQSVFQDFNPSKFIVHSCLFAFVLLAALKFDGELNWTWWAIFGPLFFWKFFASFGAAVGAVIWLKNPHFRLEGDSYVHFKAMLISLALHLILLMFELLVCDRLTSGRHLWVLVFVPLCVGSVASVGACIWSVKHDRSFELELFCAVNALQFVFIPLKLDGFVSWSWEVVFVPLWIVLCLSLVGCLYSCIFCSILYRTPEIAPAAKKAAFAAALGNCATVLPLLAFQILLADQLDGDLQWTHVAVVSPLLLALGTLTLLSFQAKGGNKWWFGIRKPLGQFLLARLPCLQEYGNISYRRPVNTTVSVPEEIDEKSLVTVASKNMRAVHPPLHIETPD